MTEGRRGFLILATDLSHRGGIGAYTEMLMRALRTVRPEQPVHLITLNCDVETQVAQDCTVTHVASPSGFVFDTLRQTLRRRPTEVIVTHLHLVPLGLVAARLVGARLTVTLHGYEVWLTQRRILRALGNRADRMVAVSRNTAARADRFFYSWVPRRFDEISLLPPAVDPERYAPCPRARDAWRAAHGFGSEDIVMLTVARLDAAEQGKGHDRVLRAMADLAATHPRLQYVIAGEGSDRARLEALVDELELRHAVRFTGFVDDLAACYAGSDLFVMPSYQEGFGIVYIEALATGLPVVAGGIDGSVEALLYGETGYLCDPLVPTSVLHAIRTAIERLHAGDPRTDPVRLRDLTIASFSQAAMAARVDRLLSS